MNNRDKPRTTGLFETREQLIDEVVKRYREGMPFNRIGKATGISFSTAKRICDDWDEAQIPPEEKPEPINLNKLWRPTTVPKY